MPGAGPQRPAPSLPLHPPRLSLRLTARNTSTAPSPRCSPKQTSREALHIDEFTKSRARHTNDNALVESKNGSVVRKHLGYGHIHSRHAQRVNDFTQNVLSPYLNFHRPCFFPSETVDAKGRRRKRYRDADIMTPYEKLKSLPEAAV